MSTYASTIKGLPVSDDQFVTTLTLGSLNNLVLHGRSFMKAAKNDPVTARQVEQHRGMHDHIQRAMSGAKLANARGDLKRYLLEEWLPSTGNGVFPPLVLWFPDRLTTELNGEFVVKPSSKALLLDGESRDEAIQSIIEDKKVDLELVQELLARTVPVVVFHGLGAADAAKYFADMNSKGVVVNANFALARDIDDVWSQLALEVFSSLGIGIETESRQVNPISGKVITAMQARTMVAAMVHGVGAVQYGSKAIPVTSAGQAVDVSRLRDAAKSWFGLLFEQFTVGGFTDKNMVLRTVPVLVSLAALGQPFYSDNIAKQAEVRAIVQDERIDWSLADARNTWAGLAGKVNATGRFSAGSGKEAAYATFKAIADENSPGGRQVRHLPPVA